MKRGPLFRLLGLKRALCPSCHRDNIWRARAQMPLFCRWCGAWMIDFAALRRTVENLAAAMGTVFQDAVRACTQAMSAFGQSMVEVQQALEAEPPGPGSPFPADFNPVGHALRMRRLPMDGQDPVVHVALYTAADPIPDPFPGLTEVDGAGYARQPKEES